MSKVSNINEQTGSRNPDMNILDIDLQHCMIEEVSARLFRENKQLQELSLAYNQIQTIPGNIRVSSSCRKGPKDSEVRSSNH